MRYKETILWGVLILAANVSLFGGAFSDSLIYLPEKVMQGQVWRLVTHPFVHVSLYHLLLDGAAFLMLYAQLEERSLAKRIGYLLGIHAAVVVAVTVSLPGVQAFGYCGLSGIAHGLMAVWCLERMGGGRADRAERRLAMGVLAGLVVKCVYEVTAGQVLFESTHLGDVGVPVVASHLAGVVGAVAVYVFFNIRPFIIERVFTGRIFTEYLKGVKGNSAMNSKVLSVVLFISTVTFVSGCYDSYVTPVTGADLGAFHGNSNESGTYRGTGTPDPTVQFPVILAVARIQGAGYYQSNPGYCVVNAPLSGVPTDENSFSSLQGIRQVVPVNKLLISGYQKSPDALRQAAASLKAQLLYVYTLDTKQEQTDWSSPVSLYTLGLSPTVKVNVTTTAMGMLVDTQTGYVYGILEAGAEKEQTASYMTRQNAWDQCRNVTEEQAFETMQKQFPAMWGRVINDYACGTYSSRPSNHHEPITASGDSGDDSDNVAEPLSDAGRSFWH